MSSIVLLRRLAKPRANPQVPRAVVPRIPSRATRLRRLIRLSSSKRLMCLPPRERYENDVVHFSFKASGAAAAHPSCMLLDGSMPRQSRCTRSPVSSAKSYKASQYSRVMDAEQPPAPLGDAYVARSYPQGSACKFVCNQGASLVTSRSSSSGGPNSLKKVAAAMMDTSKLANASRRKARASAHPPRRRCRSFRFTRRAATSIVMSMSETWRSRRNPNVLETPSRRLPRNAPESVLLDLPAFVGIRRKSYQVSLRCISMGDEPTCTSKNCSTLRMSLQSSSCAGKGVF